MESPRDRVGISGSRANSQPEGGATGGPAAALSLVQPGESCDDGNTDAGDCCDSTCRLDAAGASCGDTDVCNGDESCDGAGTCLPGVPLDCSDGNACTQDSCDRSSGCSSVSEPATTCFVAGKSAFQLTKKSNSAKNSLKWKWSKGDRVFLSNLDQPRSSTQYALCVYDGSGGVASPEQTVVVPPSSANWRRVGNKGFKYKDKSAVADGVQAVVLISGRTGKSKAQLKAKGLNLPLPLPVASDRFFSQDPSLIVQLFNDNNVCWTSEFAPAGTKKNTVDKFRAKSP